MARRNGCLRLGGWVVSEGGRGGLKLRVPVAHPSPLIAQDVFGFAQIRPEHTLSRIQLNCWCVHTLAALDPGLLGWARP